MKKIALLLCGALSAAFLFVGCGKNPVSFVEIYMPDGAPALALAQKMHMDEEDDFLRYHVVKSDTVQTYVTGETPKADLCVLPLNLASKLLGAGETYRMLGTVTHGNLYMLSTDTSVSYTVDNLAALKGKTIGVLQLQNVPGLTFKAILNQNDISWQELANNASPAADKVNLKAVTPEQVSPATGLDCYIAAEPAASLKVNKTPLEFVGDLQALYGGEKGYPQAVLVAKKSLIDSREDWVKSFAASLSESAAWLKTTETETIVEAVNTHLTKGLAPSLTLDNLSAEVIFRCGIRFESAAAGKADADAFLDKLIAVNPNLAAKVTEAFYYVG